MYKGGKVIALVPACNEGAKVGRVVERIRMWDRSPADQRPVDAILVIDDGSVDATATIAAAAGAEVLSTGVQRGVGAALRRGLELARSRGYDIAVILAGNDKDDPAQIPRLLDPIFDEDCDWVMGSRFLPGGVCGGEMPLYRKLATRAHPWLMARFTGKRLTESTNGFRALRLSVLDDSRINLHQCWLDTYGLEVYLLWKVLKLGYKYAEVPCTKVYPAKRMGYTKMTPIIGWWSILRPILLLGFGIRK